VTPEQIVERGRRVVRLEREALANVEERLGESFARAVTMIASSTGRVIVAGVGKSGLIGRKIAATLTSTGTPAVFLHPVESTHGDLCDATLDAWVREEACPHDLAPTSSTTAALALGDALAVALLEHKGFRREDFARLHPGGALGRRLVTRVDAVMLTDPLPVLAPGSLLRQAVVVLAEQRGIVLVADAERRLYGVLTAGDLTRRMEHEANVLSEPVERIMTRAPRTAHVGELASAVAFRMEQHGIMAMPVLDEAERLAGVVHLHDLLRARVA
jgi:arabinose-5-phosphate isomerase